MSYSVNYTGESAHFRGGNRMLQNDLDMIDKVLINGNFDKCHNHPYGKAGACFSLRRKEIHSNYWIYHCDDMFTITISDILANSSRLVRPFQN